MQEKPRLNEQVVRRARYLVLPLAAFVLGTSPAAATGLSAIYSIQVAGAKIVDVTATLDFDKDAYLVETLSRTRGVAAVFFPGHQTSRVTGAWRGNTPVPVRYRADGLWRGSDRYAELTYERGQPVVSALEPLEPEVRFPVAPEQQRDTTDPLSAFAQLVRQVLDTGRCDGKASVFDGRVRIEVTVRTEGSDHLDGGSGGWSGDALRCIRSTHYCGLSS